MRSGYLLLVLIGACGGSTGTSPAEDAAATADAAPAMGGAGTVAMAATTTGDIVAIDLESATSTVLDPGAFGDVAISPDGAYVAYVGLDRLPKLVDRSGHVTPLGSMTTEGTGPRWDPHGVLTFPVLGGTALVERIGDAPRVLEGVTVISPDGTRVAYAVGSSVFGGSSTVNLEDRDGSHHEAFTAGYETLAIDFTPDATGFVIEERSMDGSLHLALYAGASHARQELAILDYFPAAFPGLSRFSPDGHHVLFVATGMLQEVDLETTTIRAIASLANIVLDVENVQLLVGYLDATHVAYNRSVDQSGQNADQLLYTAMLNVADGQTDVSIVKSANENHPCVIQAADLPHGRLAVLCDHVSLVDLAGKTIAKHDGTGALGISKDGQAMVVVGIDGTVSFVPAAGTARVLGVAQNPLAQSSAPFFGPYASFAP